MSLVGRKNGVPGQITNHLFRKHILLEVNGYNEELKFNEDFEKWSEITPGFFPNFSKWNNPKLKFSFKNILRREYSSLFALIFSFTVLDLIGNYLVVQKLYVVSMWSILFWTALAAYLILRFLKRHSKVLDVLGR